MRVSFLRLSTASGSLSPVKLLLPPLLMVQLWAAQALVLPGNDTRVDLEASGALCARDSPPWQVSLFHNLRFQCSGVLVDQNWVLTAAHCWRNKPLKARIGGDHLRLFQKEQLRSTDSPVFHPKYQPCSGPILPQHSDEHNLVMLKLSSPVTLMSNVIPIKLPVKYNRSSSFSRVTLLSQKQCETFYPDAITSNMICAEPDESQDSCQSGSGDLLVCDNTLHGILSWGVYPCGGIQHPIVYSKICQYVSWIQRVIDYK